MTFDHVDEAIVLLDPAGQANKIKEEKITRNFKWQITQILDRCKLVEGKEWVPFVLVGRRWVARHCGKCRSAVGQIVGTHSWPLLCFPYTRRCGKCWQFADKRRKWKLIIATAASTGVWKPILTACNSLLSASNDIGRVDWETTNR